MISALRPAHRDPERGSAAVEAVLLTPLLILIALVVVALGRLVDTRLVINDSAHQAARAASLARSDTAARSAAQRTATDALRQAGAVCAHPNVLVTTGGLRAGGTVAAKVTCTADLGDLTKSAMPGAVDLTASAYSPVDTYRSTT